VVREAFRNNLLPLAKKGHGLDIVVLAKKAACTTENKNLFQSLDKHWLAAKKKYENYPD
jgi:RNase P protein component